MKFQGSLIKEQGVTFAIVIVKRHILNCSTEAEKAIRSFRTVFGYTPIVLMAQDTSGTPTWYGRTDIVRFLRNVPMHAIPWKEYTVG